MFPLIPHPAYPQAGITRFWVELAKQGSRLKVKYLLEGDIASLALPPIAQVRRMDELWRHMCFELFVRAPHDQAYVEYNFAPSGAWAAYRFAAYRTGITDLPLGVPPRTQRLADECKLEQVVECNLPPDLAVLSHLQANVTAVVESLSGDLTYWAVAHPAEQPDFHHADGFVVELEE